MNWDEFKDKREHKNSNGQIFVNVNRFARLFIRATRGIDQTKTFNFNRRGFEQARQWIEEL